MQLLETLVKATWINNDSDLSGATLHFLQRGAFQLKTYSSILTISNEEMDRHDIKSRVEYFQNLGNVKSFEGDNRLAAQYYQTAYKLASATRIADNPVSTLLNLGRVYSLQLDSCTEEIRDTAWRAVKYAGSLPLRERRIASDAHYILAKFEYNAGNIEESLNEIEKAISLIKQTFRGKFIKKSPVISLIYLVRSLNYPAQLVSRILKIAIYLEESFQHPVWNL